MANKASTTSENLIFLSRAAPLKIVTPTRNPIEFMDQRPKPGEILSGGHFHQIKVALEKGIVMYGSKSDRLPQVQEMASERRTVAEVMFKRIGAYYGKSFEDFLSDIEGRKEFATPFFVAYGRMGWPTGAVFPIRKNHLPRDSAELASEAYWAAEDPDGKCLVFRKLVSDTDWTPGLGKKLISGGILPLGRALSSQGELEGVFAYVFPHNYGAFSSKVNIDDYLADMGDKNYLLHSSIGAKLGRVFENACNHISQTGGILFEMDYSHLLC